MAEDGSGATGKLSQDQLLTDPDQAVDFVARTKCDALAIACGTSHGAYKFSRKTDGDILSMATIAAIHDKLPNTHLVMHGSSSVPQDLQDLINAYGGDMPQTYGVPVEEIERGIKIGGAQGEYRHRLPHGDDRTVPQGRHTKPRRI
ncbi:MAG: fructose-bisphosphate aldolase class II [Paracoccaceae bacterium]|jgi:fructose-bisphosphate aldolase class II